MKKLFCYRLLMFLIMNSVVGFAVSMQDKGLEQDLPTGEAQKINNAWHAVKALYDDSFLEILDNFLKLIANDPEAVKEFCLFNQLSFNAKKSVYEDKVRLDALSKALALAPTFSIETKQQLSSIRREYFEYYENFKKALYEELLQTFKRFDRQTNRDGRKQFSEFIARETIGRIKAFLEKGNNAKRNCELDDLVFSD